MNKILTNKALLTLISCFALCNMFQSEAQAQNNSKPGKPVSIFDLKGKPLPAFEFKDTNNTVFSSKHLKDKVLLLDFWATWCKPCVAASPSMENLHQKYAKDGLVVLGLSISDSTGKVKKYKSKHNYTFALAGASNGLYRDLGITAVPVFMLVDRKGIIREVMMGFDPDAGEKQFAQKIEKLLKDK